MEHETYQNLSEVIASFKNDFGLSESLATEIALAVRALESAFNDIADPRAPEIAREFTAHFASLYQ